MQNLQLNIINVIVLCKIKHVTFFFFFVTLYYTVGFLCMHFHHIHALLGLVRGATYQSTATNFCTKIIQKNSDNISEIFWKINLDILKFLSDVF